MLKHVFAVHDNIVLVAKLDAAGWVMNFLEDLELKKEVRSFSLVKPPRPNAGVVADRETRAASASVGELRSNVQFDKCVG